MRRTRGRLVVACLAVIGATIAVAAGSAADNRKGTATFTAVPGPGSVTYGEYISYSASLDNESTATFTQTTFRQTRPVATWDDPLDPDDLPVEYPAANPVAASCDWSIDDKGDDDPANDELVCFFGQLRPADDPQRVTVVWPAPTIPSPTGCDSCLSTSAYWLIKERKATNQNEQIPSVPDVETAELLAGQSSEETLRAGGYELAPCTPGGSNLSTNQNVNEHNPVATSFCLPEFETNDIDLGLATTITEEEGNPHKATVCIAALGTDCGETHDDAVFAAPYVSHAFQVAADALDPGYKIEKVRHNGEELPMCADDDPENPNPNGCVVSITPPKGNPKIWVIVATSPTNGPWDW